MIEQQLGGLHARLERRRTSALALSSASLLALAAAWLAPPAAQAQTASVDGWRPQLHDTIDANGVDILSGDYHLPQPAVSIGVAGQGGLSQAYIGTGNTDNLTGRLTDDGTVVTIEMGGSAETFTNSESDQKSGSTLNYDQGYVYKTSDGTVARFTEEATPLSGVQIAHITSLTRPNGETLSYSYKFFDPATNGFRGDRVQSVTNNFGYQIKYEYDDGAGRPLQIRSVHAVNNASQACDPSADSCGDLSRWPTLNFSGDRSSTMIVSDSLARQTVTSNPNGAVKTVYPGGREETFSYLENTTARTRLAFSKAQGAYQYVIQRDDSNPMRPVTTTITDPLGHVSTIVGRRDLGVITRFTDANGLSTSYAYEEGTGRLTRVTRPEQDATAYEYDARGNLRTLRQIPKPGTSDPVLVSTAAYPDDGCVNTPACNQPTSTTDELGNTTTYEYDPIHGGLLKLTKPADAQGVRAVTHISYTQTAAQAFNGSGQLVTLAPAYRPFETVACDGADGCSADHESRTTLAYSGYGNQLLTFLVAHRSDDAEVAQTTLSYDEDGNLTGRDGPLTGAADMTTYVYDAARQLVGVVDPDPDGRGAERPRARRIGYEGDGQVRLVEQGTVSSPSDWSTFTPISYAETNYDTAGRKTVDKAGDAGQAPVSFTQYGYDAADRLTCLAVRMNPGAFGAAQPDACTLGAQGADGPDRIIRYDYDAGSRLQAVTQGVGTPQVRTLKSLTYTADGLPWTEADGRGGLTSYTYDGLNRLRRVQYPDPNDGGATAAAAHLYDYQGLTRITGEQLRDGVSTATAYDGRGQVTSASVDGSSFTYDSFGRVLTAGKDGATLTNAYDSRGNLLSQSGPLGTVSYRYDEADRRTRLSWPDGFFVTYEYDPAGKLQVIRESGGPALASFGYDQRDARSSLGRPDGVTTSYGYGAAGRLSSLTHAAGNGVGFVYGLNPAGQITSRASSNSAYTAAPTAGSTGYTVNGLNQYTSANGAGLQHNARGDTTFDGVAGYGYDEQDRLTSAQGVGLSYDALGRLSGAGRARFLYDGTDLIAEYDASGALVRRYVHGPGVDEPLVAYDGAGTGSRRWLLADERGSVIGSADAAGSVASTAFDDYGQGAPVSRFGFTGQAWLPEAGVYHFKARAYSPRLGRFLQPDPSADPDSPSLYAYAGNDPVNASDPTGLDPGNTVGEVVITATRSASDLIRSADLIRSTLIENLFRFNHIFIPVDSVPKPRNEHRYRVDMRLTRRNTKCSAADVSAAVNRNIVPGNYGTHYNGSSYRVGTPVGLSPGTITFRSNSIGTEYRNVTNNGHILCCGLVTTKLSGNSTNGFSATVVGAGINRAYGLFSAGVMADINQGAGGVIFKDQLDAAAKELADSCDR